MVLKLHFSLEYFGFETYENLLFVGTYRYKITISIFLVLTGFCSAKITERARASPGA